MPKPPEVPTGPHCINPVVCEFFYHCNHPKPEDYIGYIPRLHASAIEQLEQMGIESIHEIPADFELSEFQRRACTAMQTGQPWFSADLKNEFESLKSPLYFMDFETVNPGWKRQEFNFELSYYLNCYYPLIFGGFDHLALIVNHCLGLGLGEKNVGATYKGFLDALQAKNAKLHGIFTDPKHVGFMKRVAALRHYASHRGSLAPAKIVDAPKQVPTDAELDAEIAAAGADIVYRFMPKGELRDSMVAIVRNNFKMAHYEKGKVIDGVVLIEIDGKKGFISPITDTSWNFQKFTSFMNEIFTELAKAI